MAKPVLLIVDDIFVNRVLLGEIAREIGCEFKMAGNGKEAIGLLEQAHFDMVLMDIEMPVMNGLETTKYIRSHSDKSVAAIPIVALTAHNPNDFFDEFNSAGFDELLTKPYLISKIQSVVEKFCMKK
jgi:CheY-like chemotaxis protein